MSEEEPMTSLSGCLLRLLWMMVGPVFLFICAMLIAAQKAPFPGTFDIAYGILVIFISIARWVDRPKPLTVPAEPSVTPTQSGSGLRSALL
jgi:hypothetical protein